MVQMVTDAFLGPAGVAFQFPSIFTQLTSKVSPAIGDFTKSIGDSFSGIFTGLGGAGIGGAGSQITSSITQAITEITTQFSQLGAKLSPALTTLQNSFVSAFSPIANIISQVSAGWNGFISGLQVDYSGTLKKLGDAFSTFDGILQPVIADIVTFLGDLAAIPADVKSTITVIADAALGTLETIVGDLASIVDKTVTVTVNEIMNMVGNAPTNVASGQGYAPGLPPTTPIGARQHGGPISEEGLYYLHAGEFVIPPGQTVRSPIGPGSSPNLPINLNNQTTLRVDGQAIARVTERHQILRRTTSSAYKWS
jgi:hypothetical protein